MAAADTSSLARGRSSPDPLPPVTLEFLRLRGATVVSLRPGPDAGRQGPPECRLRLADPDVSKFHCSLERIAHRGLGRRPLRAGRDHRQRDPHAVRPARPRRSFTSAGRHQIRFIYQRSPYAAQGSSRTRSRDTGTALAVEHPEVFASPRKADLLTRLNFVGMLLGPLLSEFAALQQQMAEIQQKRSDEFQRRPDDDVPDVRALTHRDQMNLIREEMDQINRPAQEQPRTWSQSYAEHATARPASLEEKHPATATPRTGDDAPLPQTQWPRIRDRDPADPDPPRPGEGEVVDEGPERRKVRPRSRGGGEEAPS